MNKHNILIGKTKLVLTICLSLLLFMTACEKDLITRKVSVEELLKTPVTNITSAAIGADPNADDNRAKIQAALDIAGHIYIPNRTFKVKGTLNVSASSRIYGSGTIQLISNENIPLLSLNAVSNITIRDITLLGNNGTATGAKSSKGTINITGGNSYSANDIKLLNLKIGNAYDYAIEADKVNRLTVDSCNIYAFGNRGINLTVSNNSSLNYNEIDGTVSATSRGVHGIQIWGKTATGEKNSTDHTITYNKVKNVSGGGIWTSHATQVTANYNTVSECGDVGIDGEATSFMTIKNNTVSNCKNGAITTFYECDNIDILNNTVTQAVGYGPGIYFYGTGISTKVTVKNNDITVADKEAVYSVTNSVANSVIENNRLTSLSTVAILLKADNTMSILNNTITVGTAGSKSVSTGIAIEGGNFNIITGNTIRSLYDTSVLITASSSTRAGIHLYWRDATYPTQNNQVSNNTITGFTTSINDNCWGNPLSRNQITNNKVTNVYRRSSSTYGGTITGNVLVTDNSTPVNPTTY